MKVVFVLDGDSACSVKKMFQARGWDIYGVDTDADVDLVCFTGGADVSPSLYGEENTGSYCDPARDIYEQDIYETYLKADIPMVGICRGGQFLNVMNGGKMIQDLKPRISGDVLCMDRDGNHLRVRVDHHQGIVRNFEKSYSILAHDLGEPVGLTYACLYPKTKSLCFQPHPEWGHKGTEELFFNLLDKYLGV